MEGDDDPPAEVDRFQFLWLAGMIIGAVYDMKVAVVGDREEAAIDIAVFAAAAALLFYVTQRRNVARLLLVPFVILTVVECLSHEHVMTSGPVALGLMATQIVVMAAAVALLFTRAAHAWFLGGPRNDAASDC